MLKNILKVRYRKYLLIFSSFFYVSIFSCEYQPTDTYEPFTDENPNPPLIQTIDLTLEEDTLYLYWNKEISFNFTTDNQKIYGVRFLLDNIEQDFILSNYGTITISPTTLSNGIHSLSIEIYTETGSGSIADELEYESFVFSNEWIVFVENDFSPVTKTESENGFLKLSWSKCKSSDFFEYIITKGSLEIGRTTKTYFTDSTFFGEGENYYINIKNTAGDVHQWCYIGVDSDLPKLKFSANKLNEYKLYWDKSKYYNAIDYIKIDQVVNYNWSEEQEIFRTSNVDDTVITLNNTYFGDYNIFTLFIKPISNSIIKEIGGKSIMIGYGNIEFNDIYSISESEYLYNLDDSVFRYSTINHEILEKTGSTDFDNLQVSPGGNYFSAYSNYFDHDIFWGSTSNFNNHNVVNLEHLTGEHDFPHILVSDVGTALVKHRYYSLLYFYDFNTNTTIASYNTDSYIYDLKFSSNGDYFFFRQDSLNLVNFENGIFSEVEINKKTFKFFEFVGDEPENCIFWENSTLSIKKCEDFSTIYEFTLDDNEILNIDYYNDEILTYTPGHIYVRSLTDGALLYEVPINFDPTYWNNKCYLLNHTIVSKRGVFYFIN